jgi:hypothetical protein
MLINLPGLDPTPTLNVIYEGVNFDAENGDA